MRYNHSLVLLVLLALFIPALAFSAEPVSKQATLIETISSSELLIEATGVYVSAEKSQRAKQKDVENNGIGHSVFDAKKSAVWFIIRGGTDPILRSPKEISLFEAKQESFWEASAISRYISYEDAKFIQRLSTDEGTGIKVTKRFKVNKEQILRDLEANGIISSRQDISETLGRPQLMVLPQAPKGVNPISYLQGNHSARHTGGVIESHLTAKQYEVLDAQQVEQIGQLVDVQTQVSGGDEDISYQIALSIGSDVYITYSGEYESSGYNTRRYALTVRAFETTTGRLLGAETGYSQARQGDSNISIEEAATGAIDAVLARIDSYWRDDASRGVQYKLVLNVDSYYDDDEAFDIQDIFIESLEELCSSVKENISTTYTTDVQVWVNPAKYNSSRALFRALRNKFSEASWSSNLKTITINRKLIQLKVE